MIKFQVTKLALLALGGCMLVSSPEAAGEKAQDVRQMIQDRGCSVNPRDLLVTMYTANYIQ